MLEVLGILPILAGFFFYQLHGQFFVIKYTVKMVGIRTLSLKQVE